MQRTTIVDLLSRREQTVLQWLSEGLRDKDIGPLLGVTTRSVTRIVREICEKLDARTRTQAVSIFLREQMTKIMWDIESVAVARSPSALFLLPAQRLLRDSNSQ
jgi:DNA-binding CsgD family transcriptional regulator